MEMTLHVHKLLCNVEASAVPSPFPTGLGVELRETFLSKARAHDSAEWPVWVISCAERLSWCQKHKVKVLAVFQWLKSMERQLAGCDSGLFVGMVAAGSHQVLRKESAKHCAAALAATRSDGLAESPQQRSIHPHHFSPKLPLRRVGTSTVCLRGLRSCWCTIAEIKGKASGSCISSC